MVECTCSDGIPGFKQLKSDAVFLAIHGKQYDGPIFRFCPWCGAELKENELQDNESHLEVLHTNEE